MLRKFLALVFLALAFAFAMLIVLAITSGQAHAQAPACPAMNPVPLVPFTKAQAPSAFGGDIGSMQVAFSGGGIALWRYDANGALYVNAIPPSSLTLRQGIDAAYDFGIALWASDPLAAFNAAYAAHVTRDMNDPELMAVWCPLWPRMVAGVTQPPAAVLSKAGSVTWTSNAGVRHDWGDTPCQALAATPGVTVKTCTLSLGGTRMDYVYTWSATAPAVSGWATRAYAAAPP